MSDEREIRRRNSDDVSEPTDYRDFDGNLLSQEVLDDIDREREADPDDK